MKNQIEIAPELIQWALSKTDWEHTPMPKIVETAQEWAAGTKQPTIKQITRFAKATNIPIGHLFLTTPPKEQCPIPDMRTVNNQRPKSLSADLSATIYACQYRQNWYHEYAVRAGLNELDFVGSAKISTPATTVAKQIRTLLNLDSYQNGRELRGYLIDALEQLGVLIMVNGVAGNNPKRTLRVDEFRGFALYDRLTPLIFVNGRDSINGQVFTLIHELAHLILGHSALSDCDLSVSKNINREEEWCNKVAAEVLVPCNDLKKAFTDCSTDELQCLSRRYSVSTLVILKCLFDQKLITWREYRESYSRETEIIAEALADRKSGGGNFYATQRMRLGKSFIRAVAASTSEGTTSYREAYKLLGTKRHATFENLIAKVVG